MYNITFPFDFFSFQLKPTVFELIIKAVNVSLLCLDLDKLTYPDPANQVTLNLKQMRKTKKHFLPPYFSLFLWKEKLRFLLSKVRMYIPSDKAGTWKFHDFRARKRLRYDNPTFPLELNKIIIKKQKVIIIYQISDLRIYGASIEGLRDLHFLFYTHFLS